MTNEEFIEMVESAISKLELQGHFSRKNGGCYYSNPDNPNVCCIVGHMMPEDVREQADDGWDSGEDTSIDALRDRLIWVGQFTLAQMRVLEDLQNIHDTEKDFQSAIVKMKDIAENLG